MLPQVMDLPDETFDSLYEAAKHKEVSKLVTAILHVFIYFFLQSTELHLVCSGKLLFFINVCHFTLHLKLLLFVALLFLMSYIS